MFLLRKFTQQAPQSNNASTSSESENENQIVKSRHPNAHPKGGFNMSSGSIHGGGCPDLIKKIGAKIISGNFTNILYLRKPVGMCRELSHLEAIANEQVYCSNFLNKAAKTQNAIEQIQLVVAHAVAGLHYNAPLLWLRAPLEPLTGETIQLQKSDGTVYFGEQIQNDPPRNRFQIIGPKNCYKVTGLNSSQISLALNLNSLQGNSLGTVDVTINENTYIISSPTICINGLIFGERIMNYTGTQTIKCEKTKLQAEIKFNYNDGYFSGFFGNQELSDKINVIIYQEDEQEAQRIIIKEGYGSWLEGISFDKTQLLWSISDEVEKWTSQETLLLSDSTLRKDRNLIAQLKMDEAQLEKDILDDLDLKDFQQRKAFNQK